MIDSEKAIDYIYYLVMASGIREETKKEGYNNIKQKDGREYEE